MCICNHLLGMLCHTQKSYLISLEVFKGLYGLYVNNAEVIVQV